MHQTLIMFLRDPSIYIFQEKLLTTNFLTFQHVQETENSSNLFLFITGLNLLRCFRILI